MFLLGRAAVEASPRSGPFGERTRSGAYPAGTGPVLLLPTEGRSVAGTLERVLSANRRQRWRLMCGGSFRKSGRADVGTCIWALPPLRGVADFSPDPVTALAWGMRTIYAH